MNTIASNLFQDPQQQRPKRCPECGGCVYGPAYICIRCRREKP